MKGKHDYIDMSQFIISSTGLRQHNLTEYVKTVKM